MVKEQTLTREQILDLADLQGRKLGFFLFTSALEEDVKEAILEIIDGATLEQIEDLITAFENGYLAANNKNLDDWFKIQLERIKWETESKRNELEQETLKKLQALEDTMQVAE